MSTDPDERGQERGDIGTVVVGLLCDPGAPTDAVVSFVDELHEDFARYVTDEVEWDVRVRTQPLDLDADGSIPVVVLARTLRQRHGWDLLICVTDLPRLFGVRAVVADLSPSQGAALASLPAFGAFGMRSRLRNTLIYLVGELSRGSVPDGRFGRERHRAGGKFTPVQWVERPDSDVEVGLALVGWRGRLRLLAGMVRDNRPWRLVPELSTALAAGFAASAFGIFYGSIWKLADASSPLRLAIISIAAVAAMIVWLIGYNALWERRTWPKGKAALYNLVTVTSLAIGVTSAYLLLFAVTFVGAFTVIAPDYFHEQLGRSVGVADYLDLAWLSSSLGMFAGALGSSLESEDAVHRATYSKRERQRRARTKAQEEQLEQQGREREEQIERGQSERERPERDPGRSAQE